MAQKVEVLLSLGSNHGDRRQNLAAGLRLLKDIGFSDVQVSPVVESPAELPNHSSSDWNKPYLNLVAIGNIDLDIATFVQASKRIQSQMGKRMQSKWEPRILDIDLVCWGDEIVEVDGKTIPELSMLTRPYVLSPLVHLKSSYQLPLRPPRSALDLSRSSSMEFHLPLWMGIVNVTPDSFSDGGRHQELDAVRATVENMVLSGVHIIDVGAESTRPKATALSADEEWQRLAPVLELIHEIVSYSALGPQLSVDTYHPETAAKSLDEGVHIINDVGGLQDERMRALARESKQTFVAMHSVSLPVDPNLSIDPTVDATKVFEKWVQRSQKLWYASGLDPARIVIDPGIGFGKSSLQNLNLMRSANRLRNLGFRILIGHSRKRFLKSFAKFESKDLDLETVGASLQLCTQHVDILRVHNIEAHTRAYLSWAHLLTNGYDASSS